MLTYFWADSYSNTTSGKYQYSSYLLATFIGGSLALMKYNQYPAQIFIGDTYCYYAGIVLALAAIQGTSLSTQPRSQWCVIGS